jgi:hypothetical protein
MLKKIILPTLALVAGLILNDIYQMKAPHEMEESIKFKFLSYQIKRLMQISFVIGNNQIGGFNNPHQVMRTLGQKTGVFDVPIKLDNDVKLEDIILDGVNVKMYSPKNDLDKTRPAIVYYHGGGYVFSSVADYNDYLNKLVKRLDVIIFAVSYDKAPENPFPGPTDQCFKATKYIFEHPNRFNIDRDKIIIAGDSAGKDLSKNNLQNFNNIIRLIRWWCDCGCRSTFQKRESTIPAKVTNTYLSMDAVFQYTFTINRRIFEYRILSITYNVRQFMV